MERTTERYTVNNADIETMSRRVTDFLSEQGLERRETERMRLTLELLLRRISEELGWGTRCALTLGRRMGRARIELAYPGKAFDPTLLGRESEGDAWSASLLADVGLVPLWSWRRGVNRLVLEPPARARSVWLGSLSAAALALGLCFFLPESWADAADRLALALLRGFGGMLTALAPLTLLLSFAAIVCGVGDTLTLGPAGRRLTGRFVARTAVWALLGTAGMAALCYPVDWTGGADEISLLGGFLPREALSPFAPGAAAQLVFAGLLAGAAVHALGGRAARVREVAEQGFAVCAKAAEYVLALAPLLTFAALFHLGARGGLDALTALWRPLAAFALCALTILTVKLAAAGLRLRLSAAELLRALWRPLRAAFATACSAAAFGRAMDGCENDLRVPHELVLNGLAIGRRLCVPFTALCLTGTALYIGACAGNAPGAPELALLAVLGAAVSVALPPLRGALLLGAAALLHGADAESLAVAAALNIVLDPLATAFSGAYLQLELAAQAQKQ